VRRVAVAKLLKPASRVELAHEEGSPFNKLMLDWKTAKDRLHYEPATPVRLPRGPEKDDKRLTDSKLSVRLRGSARQICLLT